MPMAKGNDFLFRLRDRDTQNGVTRETLGRLAHQLGLSETDVIHKALAQCAKNNLPSYEPDDGPLTAEDHRWIKQQVRQKHGGSRIIAKLLDEPSEKQPQRDNTKKVRS